MNNSLNLFDICIITASSPDKARAFGELIQRRKDYGLYPREVDFRIYADPKKGRVGSGGGTVIALHQLLKDYGVRDSLDFFRNHRVLLIHAGGESRNLPCYAPEGKIFAPIPLESSSLIPPVVLDAQLTFFFKYPWKRGEVVISSGEVIVDFPPEFIPETRAGIFGFTKTVPPETGAKHGVFLFDAGQQKVVDFFQKAGPEKIRENALLEGTEQCALDMGVLAFSPEAAQGFIDFANSKSSGHPVLNYLSRGKCQFDIYLEVLTAAIAGISYEEYKERMVSRSSLRTGFLKQLFNIFHKQVLSGALTSSATFINLGRLPDFPQACREIIQREIRPFYAPEGGEIKVKSGPALLEYNSSDAGVYGFTNKPVLLENLARCHADAVMGNNLLLGVKNCHFTMELPDGVCIDERDIKGQSVTMVYALHDTFIPVSDPSEIKYCKVPLPQWLEARGLVLGDVFEGRTYDLQKARLFCPDASEKFLAGYWDIPNDPNWKKYFKKARRLSMHEINSREEVMAREAQRMEARKASLMALFKRRGGWRYVSLRDFKETFSGQELIADLEQFYSRTDDPLLKIYRRTLLKSLSGKEGPAEQIILPKISYSEGEDVTPVKRAVKPDQIVWARSPVRLDLAGGWSDILPYTLKYGGKAVNLSVNLNGQPPLQVFCGSSEDKHVRIQVINTGVVETITHFNQLEDFQDPSVLPSLPKAALCLLGLTRKKQGKPLDKVLKNFGHGIEISLLNAVPRGSGLGSSAILGGVVLGALHRFFGHEVSSEQLIYQVLQMEQMITTRGGWQDLIGGTVGGLKFIENKPGLKPEPLIRQLDSYLFQFGKSRACMTLFYTGIQREAKNIVEEVADEVNRMSPASLFTLKHIKQLALDTREAVELRDYEALSQCVNQSWEANKLMHSGATSKQVEALLEETRSCYTSVKLLGAGGGGFALFFSRDPGQAEKLKALLRRKFENDKARIVDFQLNQQGLKVSVS
ncbi:L-fucokinase [Fibrobacterota bacterium]